MYYLILFTILVLLTSLDAFITNGRIKNLLLTIAYLLLLFTSGLRYETGVDWRAYSFMVDETMPIDKLNTTEGYESVFNGIDVGFKFLISVIKYFGGGLQVVFFVISFISTTFLILSLKRYLKYPMLGVLLYYGMIFFYLDMSGLRQATSLSIFFFSIQFIEKRNLIKYFAFLFIAFTFHWSTIFLFPMYWLANLKISKKVVASILIFAVGFYIIGVKWLTSLIPSLFQVLQNTNFANKVIIYSTSEIFTGDRTLSARSAIHVFLLILVLLLSEMYKKQLTESNRYYMVFHRLFVIQIFFYFIFYEFPEVAERTKLYFYVSNIVILASFINLSKYAFQKWIVAGFVFSYALFYGNVHILEKPNTIAYFPYQNYWVYKLFDLQSTGEQRLEKHIANTEDAVK